MMQGQTIYEFEDVIYVQGGSGNVRAWEVDEDGGLVELLPSDQGEG